jgi:hypothetical protein
MYVYVGSWVGYTWENDDQEFKMDGEVHAKMWTNGMGYGVYGISYASFTMQ